MIYWILITLVTALANADPRLCRSDLPVLSVGSENTIKTAGEWNLFIQMNPFFLLGMADSENPIESCMTEPILDSLSK